VDWRDRQGEKPTLHRGEVRVVSCAPGQCVICVDEAIVGFLMYCPETDPPDSTLFRLFRFSRPLIISDRAMVPRPSGWHSRK